MISLKELLINNSVKFKNDKISLPKWVKKIKIDIGLSFDAPHMQNWIDNDINNEVFVFGIEPHPVWVKYLTSEIKDTNFKDYHRNTKELQYSNINNKCIIVPVAINNINNQTTMKLYIPSASDGCASLLKPNESILGSVIQEYDVNVYKLSELLDLIPFSDINQDEASNSIKYIEYIKIDVQGCDINVLQSAEKYLIDRVIYVTAEPENKQYKNSENNSSENIINYMNSIGFLHINHPNTSDPTFINKKFIDKANDIYIWQKY